MAEAEDIRAVCCPAGAAGEVTVEELHLLGDLVGHVGLKRAPFNALVEKTLNDEDFREEQLDLATRETEGTMTKLIRLARETGLLSQGHMAMVLWRIAMKLDISAERFEEMLADARNGK